MDYTSFRLKNYYNKTKMEKVRANVSTSRYYNSTTGSYQGKASGFSPSVSDSPPKNGFYAENTSYGENNPSAPSNTSHGENNSYSSSDSNAEDNSYCKKNTYSASNSRATLSYDDSNNGACEYDADRYTKMANSYSRKEIKSNKLGNLIIVVILLLCFGVVISLTEFFSGGVIVNELKSAFNIGSSKKYYFVAKISENASAAKSQAIIVKLAGGAGYVYEQNAQYYIVFGAYLNNKDASAVSKKNEQTEVLEVSTACPKLLKNSGSDQNQISKAYTEIDNTIQLLYDYSLKLDSKTSSAIDILGSLSSLRNKLLSLKDEVTSNISDKGNLSVINSLIEPTFGGIDAIVSGGTSEKLAAAIRYVMCTTIASVNLR